MLHLHMFLSLGVDDEIVIFLTHVVLVNLIDDLKTSIEVDLMPKLLVPVENEGLGRLSFAVGQVLGEAIDELLALVERHRIFVLSLELWLPKVAASELDIVGSDVEVETICIIDTRSRPLVLHTLICVLSL